MPKYDPGRSVKDKMLCYRLREDDRQGVQGRADQAPPEGGINRGPRVGHEQGAPVHLDNERRLLSALAAPEQEHLADLLRKLLVSFEPRRCPCLDRLGLVLLSEHDLHIALIRSRVSLVVD